MMGSNLPLASPMLCYLQIPVPFISLTQTQTNVCRCPGSPHSELWQISLLFQEPGVDKLGCSWRQDRTLVPFFPISLNPPKCYYFCYCDFYSGLLHSVLILWGNFRELGGGRVNRMTPHFFPLLNGHLSYHWVFYKLFLLLTSSPNESGS